MHILLSFVSSLPETMGLFVVGLVLILSGVVLRKVFVVFDRALPSGQEPQPKEHTLK